jgi:two-component system OmpR family sensor kinase
LVSLRKRLTIITVLLAGLGLALSGMATFAALGDWRSQADEELLSSIGRQAQENIGDGLLETSRGDSDSVTDLWRSQAVQGDIPSLFQIRDADNQVLQTVHWGPVPDIPRDLRPGRITEGNPDGQAFRKLDAQGSGAGFRLRAAWLPDGERMLIVGMRSPESEELGPRVAGSLVTFGLASLAGVALLAGQAVKRSLRPLERIADTASAIGRGDLGRRVESADPRTEIGRLGDALNDMLHQIEAAFQQRLVAEERLRRFVADASHELRTPVATVRGYAELFHRGAAERPGDLRKAMARIESEAERMGLLVDELLLLARLDQGRPLERAPVDLTELAFDAVSDARAVDPARAVTVDTDGPLMVRGDSARLRQVLANLLANVRAHTPAGTPAVIRLGKRGEHAVLEVEDEGPGLSEQERERALERFFRADSARARGATGSGLGLSIVASVVAAHAGRVTIHQAQTTGLLVRIQLPREP